MLSGRGNIQSIPSWAESWYAKAAEWMCDNVFSTCEPMPDAEVQTAGCSCGNTLGASPGKTDARLDAKRFQSDLGGVDAHSGRWDGGISDAAADASPGDGEMGLSDVVDRLIDSLCAAIDRCDPEISYAECVLAMEGVEGMQIWDEFGLEAFENKLTAEDVREGIRNGSFIVSGGVLTACLNEIDSLCLDGPDPFLVNGDLDQAEEAIEKDGACSGVLSAVE